ncbi:hypothetical protein EDD85DRAFT_958070 [Armillaria nabsnona]|nr:hypothetical protein EDD85DRAFT_958070 [Armillaria nabsnona]
MALSLMPCVLCLNRAIIVPITMPSFVPICALFYIILIIITMPSDSKYDIEKLDNTNYYDWAYAQKLQLIKRLWNTVNGNDPKSLRSPNHVTVRPDLRNDNQV